MANDEKLIGGYPQPSPKCADRDGSCGHRSITDCFAAKVGLGRDEKDRDGLWRHRPEPRRRERCESGWTGDRCSRPLGHDGRHSNETRRSSR